MQEERGREQDGRGCASTKGGRHGGAKNARRACPRLSEALGAAWWSNRSNGASQTSVSMLDAAGGLCAVAAAGLRGMIECSLDKRPGR